MRNITVEYSSVNNLSNRRKRFADYKTDTYNWITLSANEYYPDILPYACELYKPVLVLFGQLIKSSESSERLLQQVSEIRQTRM